MQPSAQIVITGLGVEDCGAYIAACNGAGKRWTYSAADELLAAPALGSDGALVFWLYRAPWHLPPGGPMADEWLALHRRLLRGRAAFGGRLVLINADAEQPSDVLASLGLAGDGVASSASRPAIDAGMSALLAKAFDWAAPEFWDVFEALESAAPPTGRMPLFRSALQAPGADQVLTLQRLVAAGAQAPSLASDLQSVQQQLSASQQLAEQGRTQALELERENELLLLQLHQVQEELEQGFLDHRKQLAKADAAQAEQSGLLASLQVELSQQLEKVGVSAQALSAAQQLADQGRTQVSELESENELLLLQLHQVQEELEQYFLDNRQLQQVMGQSRHSLDRARHLISRLMLPTQDASAAQGLALKAS
jgi:hypothetical protein